MSAEPYDQILAVIANGFKLRRSDAITRAVRQLKEWNKRPEVTRYCEQIQQLIKSNVGKYTPRDRDGPTAEQATKPPRRDSIQSLEDADRLAPEQVSAAREIQRIVELITSSCHPRGQSYEKGSGGGPPTSLFSAEVAYRWSKVYVPWHIAMNARSDKRLKKLAEKVILDNLSLDAARKQLRMSYERGYQMLTESLDMYVSLREDNPLPPIE